MIWLLSIAWGWTPATIEVVDEQGQAVVCAYLTTVYNQTYVTDAQGRFHFYEPDLMDTDIWFNMAAQGYEGPSFLGIEGTSIRPTEGGLHTITLTATGQPASQCLPASPALDGPVTFVEVLDAHDDRPVPLAKVTAQGQRAWTDNIGFAAFWELDPSPSVEVSSPGYITTSAQLAEGVDHQIVRMERAQLARRLYRVTGVGGHRNGTLAGRQAAVRAPNINAQVAGQDSAHTTTYRGEMFWVWGDTLRPGFPLGHFKTAAATSALPADGGLDPSDGVDLNYFIAEDGFSKPMVTMGEQGDLVWVDGLTSFVDPDTQEETLVANYLHLGNSLQTIAQGVLVYRDDEERFETLVQWPANLGANPYGGSALVENGYIYYTAVEQGDAFFSYIFKTIRVPASLQALADVRQYEVFSPLDAQGVVQQTYEGHPDYQWRTNVRYVDDSTGLPEQARIYGRMRDPYDMGQQELTDHIGTVRYNPHLGRYLRIFTRGFGEDAFLGEIWAATAPTPMGPWVFARKIATHQDYSMYNPHHHESLDTDGGKTIYFEGTYTKTFSSSISATPHHDYNQIMFELDVDKLLLPVPIYGLHQAAEHEGDQGVIADFYALPTASTDDAVRLAFDGPACDAARTLVEDGPAETVFYARDRPFNGGAQLFSHSLTGGTAYTLDPTGSPTGWWVWSNPMQVPFPIEDHQHRWLDAGPDRCDATSPVRMEAFVERDGVDVVWQGKDGQSWTGAVVHMDLAPGLHVLTATGTTGDEVVEDVVVIQVVAGPDVPSGDAGGQEASQDQGCGCAQINSVGWWSLLAVLGIGWAKRSRSGGQEP